MSEGSKKGNPISSMAEGLRPGLMRVVRKFNRILDDTALFLFICLLFAAVLQVLSRYVLVAPIPWTEESARFLLVWVSFLGAASVTRRKMHIKVEYLADKFKGRLGIWVSIFTYLTMFLFLIVLFYGCIIIFISSWPVHAGTMPWLRMSWVYLGAIIGVGLMVIMVLVHLIQEIKVFRGPIR